MESIPLSLPTTVSLFSSLLALSVAGCGSTTGGGEFAEYDMAGGEGDISVSKAKGGPGGGTTTPPPEIPVTFDPAVKISSGHHFVHVLRSDGTIITRGRNHYGQLGIGTITPWPDQTDSFKFVLDPTGKAPFNDTIDICNGSYHSLALKSDGTVWAWGGNDYGELGGGGVGEPKTLPRQVIAPSGKGFLTGITSIACGEWEGSTQPGVDTPHGWSLALKNDGTVWAWGYIPHPTPPK